MSAVPAFAGEWLQWQDNSLSYLDGRDFTVQPARQQTLTLEHVDGWKYGDNFLFVDVTRFNGGTDAGTGASGRSCATSTATSSFVLCVAAARSSR